MSGAVDDGERAELVAKVMAAALQLYEKDPELFVSTVAKISAAQNAERDDANKKIEQVYQNG